MALLLIDPEAVSLADISFDFWHRTRTCCTMQLYGQTLFDTRGKVFISDSLAIEMQTVIRPREVGLKIGKKF
jgi:hypothetical protein